MGPFFRSAIALGLAASLRLPAGAADERCTHDTLVVDGTTVTARFCIPAGTSAPIVTVTETFSALGKTLEKSVPLTVVAGALTSRTIDDVDLAALGLKRSLHMTLAFHAGSVELEHALALPGAIPLK